MTTIEPGLVSILMPVFNEAASVERAVASALGQTHGHIEVLVIDGRSTDNTRELVRALAEQDHRIRLLDNPARGIAAALNLGLAACRGEYAARMDGHATVNSDYVSTGVRHLSTEAGVAAVGGKRVGVATTPTGRAIAMALSSPFGVGDSINHYATEVQRTDHASFGVYRTDVARAVGGWDETLIVNEDVDFDFRIMALGLSILYDPSMIIKWHVRETIGDLARQYRRYGRGKGAMVAKNGLGAVRMRHLAAPALVATLAGAAGLAMTGRRLVPLGLVAPYSAAVVGASVLTSRGARGLDEDSEPHLARALPAAFVAMHTSWGIGFFEGLAGRRPATASQR